MSVLALSAAPRVAAEGFECTVAAYATADAPLGAIPVLRDNPGSACSTPLPPRFLRYADEQTVVGLVAVLRAMALPRLSGIDFTRWGVLAAPRLQGRLSGAATLSNFVRQGPAAISPHVIPQTSLHAVSSAISVALGLRGPNFGIGGGPEALEEGLTVAVTFLQGASLPGMWLVLTEWDAEPIPDGNGGSTTPAVCCATALALVPRVRGGMFLRISSSGSRSADRGSSRGLTAWLADRSVADAAGCWSRPLPWGGRIECVAGEPVQERKAA